MNAEFTQPRSMDGPQSGGLFVPLNKQRRAPTAEKTAQPSEAANLSRQIEALTQLLQSQIAARQRLEVKPSP